MLALGNFILTSQLRKKLKKPLGQVVSEIKKTTFGEDKIIICVGDETSEKILKLGISPKICIYDGKIGRKKIEIPQEIKNFKAHLLQVKNPAGRLNREVFQRIAEGLKSGGSVKIYVDGEEDLSTLAAINLSPLNSIVLYGQPNQGLVVVEVNEKVKKEVEKILEEMGKEKNEN